MSEVDGTTCWLPGAIIQIVDKVKAERGDTRRSDTVKFLLILGLAEIEALDEDTKRVHGLNLKTQPKEVV